MDLLQLGWNTFFARAFEPYRNTGFSAARVITVHSGGCRVAGENGEIGAAVSGRLSAEAAERPVVGDWVVLRCGAPLIEAVLPRRTLLARRQPGSGRGEQPLAANVDVLAIVTGLDGDFSLRRIERYLVLARQSGADPLLVLSKADLLGAAGQREALEAVRRIAPGAPVMLWSAFDPLAPDALSAFFTRGQTAALAGSSGAGKSTMVNRLLGREAQRTQPVREDDGRGRHTTTRRELILLAQGWLLVDMPGLREVGLLQREDAVDGVFDEIAGLAERCRFRDCTHTAEPGCAVLPVADPARLEQYHRLRKEAERLDAEQDPAARLARKQRDKVLHRAVRQVMRMKPRF